MNTDDIGDASAANILDTLKSALQRASEKVGLVAFGWLFSNIIRTISDYVQKLMSNFATAANEEELICFMILNTIYHSEHHSVLIACFFRIMIVKAGIQASQVVKNSSKILANDVNVNKAMEALASFSIIQDAYCAALTHPYLQLGHQFMESMVQKIIGTVQALGHGALANDTIASYYRDIAYHDKQDHKFLVSLRTHILTPVHRFGSDSKIMRKFLREVCKYCSTECLNQLEQIWRTLLTTYAHDRFLALYASIRSRGYADIVEESRELTLGLSQLLEQLRQASRVDMCIGYTCYMSADMAFESAYRRLPRDVALAFTRSIAIRLSSHIDIGSSTEMRQETGESLDNVQEMIEVSVFFKGVVSLVTFLHLVRFSFTRMLVNSNTSTNCYWLADC